MVWSPKMAASKLTTQPSVLFFYSYADVCAVAMASSRNISRSASKIGFVYLQKKLVVRFSLQFAWNKVITMLEVNTILTTYYLIERTLIIPCWKFAKISKISSAKVQFFLNTPVFYFLKCSRAKFHEILTSGSPEISVFPRKVFLVQLQVFDLLRIRYVSLGSFGFKEIKNR